MFFHPVVQLFDEQSPMLFLGLAFADVGNDAEGTDGRPIWPQQRFGGERQPVHAPVGPLDRLALEKGLALGKRRLTDFPQTLLLARQIPRPEGVQIGCFIVTRSEEPI